MANTKISVILDISALTYASTGIRTYITALLSELQFRKSDPECDVNYVVVPSFAVVEKFSFFKRPYLPPFIKYSFHAFYFFWKQIALPIATMYYRADVLLCPDFVSPFWKLKTLKVSVLHDAFFWQHPSNYSPLWRKYYIFSISKGLRGRSIILTTSEYSKGSLLQFLKYDGPIEVVYQCAGTFESSEEMEGDLHNFEKLGLQRGKFILHVGYFDKRKNLETLVKAYDLFIKDNNEEIKLVLVGGRAVNSALDDYDLVADLLRDLGLEDRVVMTGYVDKHLLGSLYRNALMYVFPSYNEGFGIPVLEAMSFQIPIIVSDSGALKEIGGEAVILFDTFDYIELASKIREVATNDHLREELITKGNKRIASFSKSIFFDSVESVMLRYVR